MVGREAPELAKPFCDCSAGSYSLVFSCEGILSDPPAPVAVSNVGFTGRWTRQPPPEWPVGKPLDLMNLPTVFVDNRDQMGQQVPAAHTVRPSPPTRSLREGDKRARNLSTRSRCIVNVISGADPPTRLAQIDFELLFPNGTLVPDALAAIEPTLLDANNDPFEP